MSRDATTSCDVPSQCDIIVLPNVTVSRRRNVALKNDEPKVSSFRTRRHSGTAVGHQHSQTPRQPESPRAGPANAARLKPRRGGSPLVRFQSMEVSVAFSRGSPTMPSSSCAREWHDASTWTLSGGASETGQISGRPLRSGMVRAATLRALFCFAKQTTSVAAQRGKASVSAKTLYGDDRRRDFLDAFAASERCQADRSVSRAVTSGLPHDLKLVLHVKQPTTPNGTHLNLILGRRLVCAVRSLSQIHLRPQSCTVCGRVNGACMCVKMGVNMRNDNYISVISRPLWRKAGDFFIATSLRNGPSICG